MPSPVPNLPVGYSWASPVTPRHPRGWYFILYELMNFYAGHALYPAILAEAVGFTCKRDYWFALEADRIFRSDYVGWTPNARWTEPHGQTLAALRPRYTRTVYHRDTDPDLMFFMVMELQSTSKWHVIEVSLNLYKWARDLVTFEQYPVDDTPWDNAFMFDDVLIYSSEHYPY